MDDKKEIISLGSEIEVRLEKIKDRLSQQLIQKISINKVGVVSDYKLTDGKGIGFIVRLNDGTETWFFPDEIKFLSSQNQTASIKDRKYEGEMINHSSKGNLAQINYKDNPKRIKGVSKNKNFRYLLNPMSFTDWLIYSLKDVF